VWRTVNSGGRERHYLLARPDRHGAPGGPPGGPPGGVSGAAPAPLILEFHGLTSNAEQQAAYSGLAAAGAARGFVVATAQGSGRVPHWNYPGMPGVDDVAFVDDLVDAIGREVAIDTRRIFAAGISNGAGLVTSMVSRVRRPFAGIAAVAGANIARAVSAAPIGVLIFHGTDDPLIPYAGGRYFQGVGGRGRGRSGRRFGPRARASARGRLGEPGGGGRGLGGRIGAHGGAGGLINLPAAPVEQTAADWARVGGCDAAPAETRVGADVRHLVYGRCARGATVELFAVDGGGHVWPGARDVAVPMLGRTTRTVDATAVILDRWCTP
jgi:polyhydroxybutyrate depolymerase